MDETKLSLLLGYGHLIYRRLKLAGLCTYRRKGYSLVTRIYRSQPIGRNLEDKLVKNGSIDSRFHQCGIDGVKSRGQLEGFHFTCLFFYFGDLQGEDLRNWRQKKVETDDIPNKLQCLHVLIIGYIRDHKSNIGHF